MKKIMPVMIALIGFGCSFASESYVTDAGDKGYEIKGSYVGYDWKEAQDRVDSFCGGDPNILRKTNAVPRLHGLKNAKIVPKHMKAECRP
ncbi:MAG: hypothetical protein ACLFPX_01055 [Candidatus Omnitrophota bacterium]